MKANSGIKVWYHPAQKQFVLSWHVYGCVEFPNQEYQQVVVNAYQYVGEAIENENGVTCIFHESFLTKFELIGFL